MKRSIVALAGLLLFASCSSGPAPTVTVTAPAPSPSVEATPSPPPSEPLPEPTGEPEPEDVVPEEVPEPRNPVPMLKGAAPNCKTDAVAGEVDIMGNRYATCYWQDNGGSDGTAFEVRTYPGEPERWSPEWPFMSSDSQRFIIGEDFIASVTGDWSTYSDWLDEATLQELAKRLGGKYLAPGEKS